MDELEAKGNAARQAARRLAKLPTRVKDDALLRIAEVLEDRYREVLEANERDRENGKKSGLTEASIDRLYLDRQRLEGMASDVRNVVALPDPVGETFEMRAMPNGLQIGKRRVPLGVIGAIYESRPNVTVDISALCLKSGNAVILRGGREAVHSNAALAGLVRGCIEDAGVPVDAVQFIESTDRALVGRMLKMKDAIDLIIPRGGQDLVRRVAAEAVMPAVTGGVGVCHTYVDGAANLDSAVEIAYNAKVQRPSVCNALDTLIVHSGCRSSLSATHRGAVG